MSSLAQVMQLESRRATTKTQAIKGLNFSQETMALPQLVQLIHPPKMNPSSVSWKVNHSRTKYLDSCHASSLLAIGRRAAQGVGSGFHLRRMTMTTGVTIQIAGATENQYLKTKKF